MSDQIADTKQDNTSEDQEAIEVPAETQSQETASPNAEAKKYRLRLRDAEAERDQLRAQLANLQNDHLARLMRSGELEHEGQRTAMREPDDLFVIGGHSPDEFITDDGTIDTKALAAAMHGLIGKRPELRQAQNQRPNAAVSRTPQGRLSSTWEAAFSPRK